MAKRLKTPVAILLAMAVLVSQVGVVFAAPFFTGDTISGAVTGLTCTTDPVTGSKTFFVTISSSSGTSQTVHIDQLTAEGLGLITVNEGIANCSEEVLKKALGKKVTINLKDALQEEEFQHPVGAALATFFSEVIDYTAIMDAHEDGFGFGVIAQALWLTLKIDSNFPGQSSVEVFRLILTAKQDGDFKDFDDLFKNGPAPKTWDEFRKAVADGEKQGNLGMVVSDKFKDQLKNGNSPGNGNDGQSNAKSNRNKDKEKGNNGNNKDKGNGKNR